MGITIKSKKCSGIGKAISFKGCGKETLNRKFGLCMNCYPDFILNSDAGKVILEKAMIKSKVIVKKENNQKTKIQKDKLKNWSVELQKKVNLIVRLIDKGLPCLATQRIAKKYDAGHVFARGGNQTIRFNLHNIHRQSAQSNHFQNDDGLLREGIVREYGQEYMTFISELRRTPQLKYNNNDYHNFYKKASEIALKLKKEDKEYLPWERLLKRDIINADLGIYDVEYCFHEKPF